MPVENFSIVDTGNALTFLAFCHGKEELVDIPDELWDNTLGTQVNLGYAFKEKTDDPGETLDR